MLDNEQTLTINGDNGWKYIFRKQPNRPIEFKKSHETLGDLGGWHVAKNYCLKALIDDDALASHFGMTAWQFRYN